MKTMLRLSACAVAICAVAPAYAQDISAELRGQVTSGGAAVAGAKVTVTHVPSGTTTTSTTSADGSFGASGLRIGGPFTVKVVAAGYVETSITDISLSSGQPFTLPIVIAATGNEIVVKAASIKGITDASGGPATSLNRAAIANVASVTRDIRDIVRHDPMATIDPVSRGVSIAGQNARLNRFSVDGVRYSDNFGLNTGGLPTARGPVPLDAVEQLSVKIAPYDIREGDFQGAEVNVVLRSGTNSFHGSAFFTESSDGLTGNQTKLQTIQLNYKSKTWGGFLSGPIIKDKLFFAVSYEQLKEGNPVNLGPAGFPTLVPGLTQSLIDDVTARSKAAYNYDTLGTQSTFNETDKKFTVKLDWNISSGQRLSATYIKNISGNSAVQNGSNSTSTPSFATLSDDFKRPEKTQSYVVQLNSDWGGGINSEIRGNYRDYKLDPVPFGAFPFSQMQVCTDATSINSGTNTATSCGTGVPSIFVGPDAFRHFNLVHTKQYGAEGVLTARWGAVTGKIIAGWQHLDVANAFTPNAYGAYYFDSLADFTNKQANSLTLAGSIDGNINSVLASFKYDQFTFGSQAAWDPSPRFNLTVGGRFDTYSGITPPPINTNFVTRYGFSNNHVINGKLVFQPRMSFKWKPEPNLSVRGGIGLFAGGSPDVFLGNSYSVAGVYGNSVTIRRNSDGTCTLPDAVTCAAALNGVTGLLAGNTAVNTYLQTNVAALSQAPVNAMDPNYKMESTWKVNLTVDWKPKFENFLGHGWSFGTDIYYGMVNNAPTYIDLRLAPIGTMPDGRTRYALPTTPAGLTGTNNDYLLTNTTRGHSLVLVARAEKNFDFGLSTGISYTFQDIKDVSAASGTTASGTYGVAMVDPNAAAYGTSVYQIRNAIKFHIDYEHAFFGDYKTRIAIFGEKRSGLPYSLTMQDSSSTSSVRSIFGTVGTNNRYLLYVPNVSSQTADALVTYADTATYTNLANFVTANNLKQGAIIGKNSQKSPSFFKVDLHAEQEIPVPMVHIAKLKVFADIENVLNLINNDWGSIRQASTLSSIVNVACATLVGNNCTQYRYSNFTAPNEANLGKYSLWGVRLGIRAEF